MGIMGCFTQEMMGETVEQVNAVKMETLILSRFSRRGERGEKRHSSALLCITHASFDNCSSADVR